MSPFRSLAPALLAALLACGGGDEPGEAADGASTADAPAPAVDDAAPDAPVEFTAVDLPGDFPEDFPTPPDAVVTSATAESDGTGVLATATIMRRADPLEQFQWYKDALAGAGWSVTNEAATDDVRMLHAEQGESYTDLLVSPHVRGDGWVETSATVWKVEP